MYFVSPRGGFDDRWVLHRTFTLDEAVHKALVLSGKKENFGSVFFVWHREKLQAKPVVRAFAQAGTARWAKPCPKSKAGACASGCVACGGLGLVEELRQ